MVSAAFKYVPSTNSDNLSLLFCLYPSLHRLTAITHMIITFGHAERAIGTYTHSTSLIWCITMIHNKHKDNAEFVS